MPSTLASKQNALTAEPSGSEGRREGLAHKLAAEPEFFFERCLSIVPKEGGKVIRFSLNDEQREVLSRMMAIWRRGDPVRIVTLKARQLGISTLMEAFIYWLTSTRHHFNSLVLAHDVAASRHILSMSTRFSVHDARHRMALMPKMVRMNRDELVFDNPDWKRRTDDPGLDSRMRIAAADNKSVGHASTLNAVHASEVARWRVPEVLAGLVNAVPFGPETFMCLESTANGPQGIFYDIWKAAESGRNEWTPIFLSWKGRREYRVRKFTEDQLSRWEPTPDEEKLMRLHGLTVEEVEWRRRMIASPACHGQGRPPEDVFREQYPLTADEAFVGIGRQYFDMGAILLAEEKAKEEKFQQGKVRLLGEAKMPRPNEALPMAKFEETKIGYVRIWKMPENGQDYVVGADIAAGVKGGDYSVAYVMKRQSQEVVARYRALIDPDRFADDLLALSWLYNEAFLAPESNSIGLAVSMKCARVYRRMCYYRSAEGDASESRPGFWTTRDSRPQIMGNLRQAVRDGAVIVHCEEFLSEAKEFVVGEGPGGRLREDLPRPARFQSHDDCVVAMAITLWVNSPGVAGVIRKPKSHVSPPKSWQEAAMREEIEREKKAEKRQYGPEDEHLGRGFW